MILYILLLILAIYIVTRSKPPPVEQKEFIFIIYFHNNYNWISQCLSSIFTQKYDKYKVVCIIDKNEKNSVIKLKDLIKYWSMKNKTEIVLTSEYFTDTIKETVDIRKEEDIVFLFDGYNWLPNDMCLVKINEAFSHKKVEYIISNSYTWNSSSDMSVSQTSACVCCYSYLLYSLDARDYTNLDINFINSKLTGKSVKLREPIIVKNNAPSRYDYNGKEILRNGKDRMFDKVFLINLKKRYDRLLFSDYKLRNTNLEVVLWTAEDGYTEENTKLYNEKFKDKTLVKSPGALGLLLTYDKLIKYCSEQKFSSVLILEDDFYFKKNFMTELKKIKFLKKYPIVYLGGNQYDYSSEQKSQMETQNYYDVSLDRKYCTYGTYGIILNKKMIEALAVYDLKASDKPIDFLLWTIQENNPELKGVVVYPNLVIPEVRDSDNMGKRDLDTFAKKRGWDLAKYDYVELFEDFNKTYKSVYIDNNVSLRHSNEATVAWLPYYKTLQLIEGKNQSFVFIIPSHNNEKWIIRNLESVLTQKFPLWRIIYIDDNSSDKTNTILYDFIQKRGLQNKIKVIENTERNYQAYSRYLAYQQCMDDEICCFLDGDDWLSDDYVLTHLNKIYKSGYLCTYGRFCYYENNFMSSQAGVLEFPKEIIDKKAYRQYKWISQHLRTCRAQLIKSIPKKHIQDDDGNWLRCCTDLAEMFWILEQSNGKHVNAGKLMYVYNRENSKQYEYSYYRDDQKEYKKRVEELIRNRR